MKDFLGCASFKKTIDNSFFNKSNFDFTDIYYDSNVILKEINSTEKKVNIEIKTINNKSYAIVFHGELYNRDEILSNLKLKDYTFEVENDILTVLIGYIHYGINILEKLNGVYSFVIFDKDKNEILIARDRLGIKSLFYNIKDDIITFSTTIKDLFKFPNVKPIIDEYGLCEILGLGPARTSGCGVFKDIKEIKAGNYAIFNDNGFEEIEYWNLKSKEHTDTYEETVEKSYMLFKNSVENQMRNGNSCCSMLSGGLDSSTITSLYSKTTSTPVKTFSFDYTDNNKFFKSSSFQPEEDKPWVEKVINYLKTDHTFLYCSCDDLLENLYTAVDAKDLPGMADIDSSLLYFLKEVKKNCDIALTGECADEIFGGYPWFHRKEFFEANTFPWSIDISTRKFIFNENVWNKIKVDEYIQNEYNKCIAEVPVLESENAEEKRRREIAYLNIKCFMPTLIYRLDKLSESADIVARAPFADYKIAEYIFNVPWNMKCPNNVVKGLLRDSCKEFLPDDILNRKKSPFPKTYNPNYEKLLIDEINKILEDVTSPVLPLLNIENLKLFMGSINEYKNPWFGQLMSSPQMLAYIIQINYWLIKYNIILEY